MFAPGPAINPLPLVLGLSVCLLMSPLVEKYVTKKFVVSALKIEQYPFNGYKLLLFFNIIAVVASIVSVPLFHKFMVLSSTIPIINVKLDDALTGVMILAAFILPRYLYFLMFPEPQNNTGSTKVFLAITINSILLLFAFVIIVIVIGNVYRTIFS